VEIVFGAGASRRPQLAAGEVSSARQPYAWYQWTVRAKLNPGVYEIWSRAIDALGRTQPLDGSIFWNPNGYEWTGVFKSEVAVK
jgi:hypothetical protein